MWPIRSATVNDVMFNNQRIIMLKKVVTALYMKDTLCLLLVLSLTICFYIIAMFSYFLHTTVFIYNYILKSYCGEWGGAESRGNGARPVE